MKAKVAYADQRLDAWASWVRGNQTAWPPRTILARIIEEGLSGAAHGGSGVISMPEVVGQTDRAVARIDRDLSKVLKVYYLVHASSELKAARCRISRATFWRRVERGQIAVYDELDRETQTPYDQASSQIFSPDPPRAGLFVSGAFAWRS